jgi:prepilin-type processing-associated H-X9-DG protein
MDWSCGSVIQPQTQGAFSNNISVSFADIKDGTSNTFLIGEELNPREHQASEAVLVGGNQTSGPYWGAGQHSAVYGCIVPPNGAWWTPPGPLFAMSLLPNGWFGWVYSAFYFTRDNNNENATGVTKGPYFWDFCGNHPGGVNMGLCDGSVKWIKNSISIVPWSALATIAGGEQLSADQY